MKVTVLLGFNNSGKTTWMKEQNPDVWIVGQKNKFLLSDKENCVVAYENPETGFHPTLHADYISLIVANAINRNQEIIIETHSEVMLLRLRRLIACNKINSSDCIVNWFDVDNNNNCFRSYPIYFETNGDMLYDLPLGVFEEDITELKGIIKQIDEIKLGELYNYFPNVFKELSDDGYSGIRKIDIDKKGYLSYFPDGVFEECYKELLAISEEL